MAFLNPASVVRETGKFIPGGAAVAGPVLAAGALTVGVGMRAMAKVPQEYVGLRIHNGRARAVKDEKIFSTRQAGELYGLVRPGLRFVMPGAHGMEIIGTQNRNTDLTNFMLMSTLNRQHEINAVVTWGVVKEFDENHEPVSYDIEYPELVFKALMAAHNIEEMGQSISGICTDGLRPILQTRERPDFAASCEVETQLVSSCGEELLMTYGAEIRRLNIKSASYSAADMLVNGRLLTDEPPAHDAGSEGASMPAAAMIFPGLVPGINGNGHA